MPDVYSTGTDAPSPEPAGAVPAVPPREPVVELRKELRTPRAAGVAGIVFAVLYLTSMLLLRRAGAGITNAQVAESLSDRANAALTIVGMYLAPFSGVAFLWFIAVIRDRVGSHEDRFFSTIFLGSGLLFVAMLFSGAAAAGSIAASASFQQTAGWSPEFIRYARSLAYSILMVYSIKAAGVFTVTASTIMLRLGALPRWLAMTGYVVAAVLLLSAAFFDPVLALFPLWVAGISIALLISKPRPDVVS
jgi:hypothetical protein